ncbi:MAG: hypothetical protein Q4E05_08590, partial [Pseudoclavibacter sp.]|nr:hypothetical protein [Pseudoclavibacter sp.]
LVRDHRALLAAADGDRQRAFGELIARHAALRLLERDVRLLAGVLSALAGRRNGTGEGVRGFGGLRGTLFAPLAAAAAILLGAALLLALSPSILFSAVVLLGAALGLLRALGPAASRFANPHLLGNGRLTARWGDRVVLDAPLTEIAQIGRERQDRSTRPGARGGRLVLCRGAAPNVRIRFARPLAAEFPDGEGGPVQQGVHLLLLHLSEPEAFLQAVQEQRDRWPAPPRQAV